ncbi:MAG: hypothetical protein ACO1TE_12725, partial [Prosthecobacter sp.]
MSADGQCVVSQKPGCGGSGGLQPEHVTSLHGGGGSSLGQTVDIKRGACWNGDADGAGKPTQRDGIGAGGAAGGHGLPWGEEKGLDGRGGDDLVAADDFKAHESPAALGHGQLVDVAHLVQSPLFEPGLLGHHHGVHRLRLREVHRRERLPKKKVAACLRDHPQVGIILADEGRHLRIAGGGEPGIRDGDNRAVAGWIVHLGIGVGGIFQQVRQTIMV